MEFSLPAFNEPIKDLIGKYYLGHITVIYGNAASGKTTTCLLATIAAAKSGYKIIYIDTENTFSTERIKQLYFGDINQILDNIFLFQPKNFTEQHDAILTVKKLAEKDSIKLVVVDTIGHHYRNVVNENPKEINGLMAQQMPELVRIARDFNKVVLLTNQVHSKVDGKDEVRMVGGKFIEKMAKVIIELKNDKSRYAKLVKYKYEDEKTHPNLDKVVEFEIKEKGLFIL